MSTKKSGLYLPALGVSAVAGALAVARIKRQASASRSAAVKDLKASYARRAAVRRIGTVGTPAAPAVRGGFNAAGGYQPVRRISSAQPREKGTWWTTEPRDERGRWTNA